MTTLSIEKSSSPTARDDRAAVDKAVSLLLAFGGQASSGVGGSELARRSGLSKTTAFRVLGMLERNGVVERVGQQYRLGQRLHDLGRRVYSPEHDQIRDLLTPFVTELYEQTHQTVHLAVLYGADVVYLAKLYGLRQVPAPSRIGGRAPAHGTAVGKAMLAHDPTALQITMDSGLPAITDATVTDPMLLDRQLAQVRSKGAAYDIEEVKPGLFCVAMPILTRTGRPLAALSVSIPTVEGIRQVEPALREVSGKATRFVRTRLSHSHEHRHSA